MFRSSLSGTVLVQLTTYGRTSHLQHQFPHLDLKDKVLRDGGSNVTFPIEIALQKDVMNLSTGDNEDHLEHASEGKEYSWRGIDGEIHIKTSNGGGGGSLRRNTRERKANSCYKDFVGPDCGGSI